MLIGYARSSTVEQVSSVEAQRQELAEAGCERVYSEQVSSVDKDHRVELQRAVEVARAGDTLVVTKLDRLARSIGDFVAIQERLAGQGVTIKVLNMNLDTGTATGKLMVNMLVSVAQFEREIMLERQREGIARAKAEGKYKGRKPTARAKSGQVRALRESGVGPTEIARRLGISRMSVYRLLEADP